MDATAAPSITEYPLTTPLSVPFIITTGPDGNLWFTETGKIFSGVPGDRIGQITPQGQITEYTVPTHHPYGIATGSDGNLWFTEECSNKIGRMTTTGQVTEFDLPSDNGCPYSTTITAGPDGNLWYTRQHANVIGRITTQGQVTEFPLPTYNGHTADPFGITTGPDGNLWFTEESPYANRIGRMTPQGTLLDEYPVPTPNTYPEFISAGPDGNLWFSESYFGKIGRITLSGQVTEYPALQFPGGITAGADGNLWFTGYYDKVGRITPGGIVTVYTVPSNQSHPFAITNGPDGNIWFTEEDGGGSQHPGAIGKLIPLQLTAYKFTPDPIAPPASLGAASTVNLTLTALDGAGDPDPGLAVYLSFQGAGIAAAGGMPLTSTPQSFTADAQGQISLTYTSPVSPPAGGGGTDKITASDAASNPTITATDSYSFAPLVSVSGVSSGWVDTDPTVVHINASDTGGLAEVDFGIDGAPLTVNSVSGTTASVPVNISGDGVHTLVYKAVDTAGASASGTATIRIDITPPTITYTGNSGSYALDATVNITCSASDAESGVASDTCKDINGPAYSFGAGSHTYSATATDNAGNVGSGSTTFTVVVTADSLCQLANQFSGNAPPVKGLCAKLDSISGSLAAGRLKTAENQLHAFENQVDALTGKVFTPEQADILKQLAESLFP